MSNSATTWSLPGSSVHEILQTRILEWVAIPFSEVFSWPRDGNQVSCTAGRFFTVWATKEAPCCTKLRAKWVHLWNSCGAFLSRAGRTPGLCFQPLSTCPASLPAHLLLLDLQPHHTQDTLRVLPTSSLSLSSGISALLPPIWCRVCAKDSLATRTVSLPSYSLVPREEASIETKKSFY